MNAPLPRREELHFQGSVCGACGETFPAEKLDDEGWCVDCGLRMQRRLRLGRHLIAFIIMIPFAVQIWRLEKLDFLPPYAWLLPLLPAYYLGFRIGHEVVKGYTRWRRGR